MIDKAKLIEIFPGAARSKLDLDQLAWQLTIACGKLVGNEDFSKVVLYRQASFLAQTAHESASFTAVKENLNYSAKALRAVFGKYFPNDGIAEEYARQPEKIANRVYANRMGNGDEASGDGWKFRGRGLIQLTGKNNYESCGNDLMINLIDGPEWLEGPQGAVSSALWYWNKNNLNSYADVEDIRGMTKRINGGYHGLDDRIAKYNKAKEILGASWDKQT